MSHYIPIELIRDIIAGLPMKPLLRCTSVCKLWYELITSPSFISSHLNLSVSKNEDRILVRFCTKEFRKTNYLARVNPPPIEKEHFYIHSDNQTLDQIGEVELQETAVRKYFFIVGAINGVVCLHDSRIGVILWNPSLRKSLALGKVPVKFCKYEFPYFHLGFGFLPSTNTYKIVKITYFHHTDAKSVFPIVEIYELESDSTGSWRNAIVGNFPYVMGEESKQAFVNCTVHWPARNPYKAGGDFLSLIVTFDMKSETLGALMIPTCMRNITCRFNVSRYKEALCVYYVDSVQFFSMWVMKEYGVEDSWEKLINIDARPDIIFRPLFWRKNGDILLKKFDKTEDFLNWNLVSVDPKTNKATELVDSVKGSFLYADNYVESLILINAPKGLE